MMSTGTNLPMCFTSNSWSDRPEDRIPTIDYVDFDKEPGKVSTALVIFSYTLYLFL